MAVLRFKGRFAEPVKSGAKTQTLRAKVPAGVRVGIVVDAASSYSKPPWAKLRIEAIEPIAVKDLDDEVARRDGFDDAASLRAELKRLYPDVRELFAIQFVCVDWAQAVAAACAREHPRQLRGKLTVTNGPLLRSCGGQHFPPTLGKCFLMGVRAPRLVPTQREEN